ncbi:MAG: MarR family transcriptional regulator, partial [Oscillospiraceae bacterium]
MLNDKTRPVYEFIKDCAVDGISPTVREICAALGLKSTSTAQRYVNSLAEQGLIEKSSNLNRSIRLAGKGAMRVPLVGMVTAGQPITAIEDIT